MRKVLVRKAELRNTLRTNRAAHRRVFEKAWEGYREQAIARFERNLEAAKEGRPFEVYLGLEPPQDHTDDYDRALQMLDWEVDDTVDLTEQEFANFVQDEWGWSRVFAATTSNYLST